MNLCRKIGLMSGLGFRLLCFYRAHLVQNFCRHPLVYKTLDGLNTLKNPKYVYGPLDVEVPTRINFGEFILNKFLMHKDHVAFINENTQASLTYSRICQEAVNLAISLSRLGLRPGQAVAICSENRRQVWSGLVGVLCAGAVVTPLNIGYTTGELTHVLNISKPDLIIASPSCYKNYEKTFKSQKLVKNFIVFEEKIPNTIYFNDLIKDDIDLKSFEVPDVKEQPDTAFIMYSSGTTGLPKGVMISHLNAIATLLLPHVAEAPDLNKKVTLSVTPWFHAMGLMFTLSNLLAGMTIVTLDKFEPYLYMKTVEKYKITRLTVAPPMLVALAKSAARYDLSSVEYFMSGAASLPADIIGAVKSRFPGLKAILQGYGMTESTLVISKEFIDGIKKPGSVGTVVSGSVVKILDLETRQPLGPRQQGEICVKGITIMKGYVGKDPKEDFDDEGFLKTGDIGYYDEDGFLYIVGRFKELIKYKSNQVSPAEIEAVLLQHGSVRDAGVVGLAHHTAGEVPLAFVVSQPGSSVSEKELQAFVAAKLSNPKHLRGGVRFVLEIPKNSSGKILRKHLTRLANKINIG